MELPWLKNRKNEGGGGPPVLQTRTPDDGGSVDLMDQVVDELWEALAKKDKQMFRDALRALVLDIQDQDKAQDEEQS